MKRAIKRMKPVMAWAVVDKQGTIQTTNYGDPETWRLTLDADASSYPMFGARVIQVEIREVVPKRRKR